MFLAAFTSACSVKLQARQAKTAWLLRLPAATFPHALQHCEVYAGLTLWTRPGAYQRNLIQPALGTHTAPVLRDRRRMWAGLTATIRNPSFLPAFRQVGLRCVPAKKFDMA